MTAEKWRGVLDENFKQTMVFLLNRRTLREDTGTRLKLPSSPKDLEHVNHESKYF